MEKFYGYIAPEYEGDDAVASDWVIREKLGKFVDKLLKDHFGGRHSDHVIKNSYEFSAHLGQAMRYLDAAVSELDSAERAAFYAKRKRESGGNE